MTKLGGFIAVAVLGGVCLFAFQERRTSRYCRSCGTDARSLEYRLGPVCMWRSSETRPSHVLRDLLPADHAHEWLSGGSSFRSFFCEGIG